MVSISLLGDVPGSAPAARVPSWRVEMSRDVVCCSLGVLGLDRDDAVQRESQARDPLEQPLKVRGIDDCTGDIGHSVVGEDRHSFEGGGVAWSEFAFDDEAVLLRRHRESPSMTEGGRGVGGLGPGSPG